MSVSKHNLWKKKKNGLHKLVRSHKQWKMKSNYNKEQLKKERLEELKKQNIGAMNG